MWKFAFVGLLTMGLTSVPAMTVHADEAPASAPASAPTSEPEPSAIQDHMDQVSYSIGVQFARNLQNDGVTLNPEMVLMALQDVYAAGDMHMTDEQMNEAMLAFAQARQQAFQETQRAYLENNKEQPGVVTLPSGLQYRVITAGEGDSPTKTERVTTHYRGRLTTGQEFDSSYKRGQPATFAVGGVIAGWTEALQLMKPGAKWELVIPAELAYGPRGTGSIPGDSTLIFEVELLEVLK